MPYDTVAPNQSAFPIPDEACGLTKREYMATAILQGMLANPYLVKEFHEAMNLPEDAAKLANRLMDALNKQ